MTRSEKTRSRHGGKIAVVAPAPPQPPPPSRVEFETFRNVGSYERDQLTDSVPSCFNGMVRVRRYRITIELIDEPVEVIHARLIEMWAAETNRHNWGPLRAEAARYGLDLSKCGVERGSKEVKP